MTQIELIKAEIERRLNIVEPYKDTYESAAASRQELIWMKDFISSLPQEQPSEDLKSEVERYWAESGGGSHAQFDKFVRVVKHFTQWQKEHPSEDLEEAAQEYSKRVSDGHNFRDLTCGFKAGAQWQKAQMMKDAVVKHTKIYRVRQCDAVRIMFDLNWPDEKECKFHPGDNVKVIIIKEEQQ